MKNLLLIFLFLGSCTQFFQGTDEDPVVARVGDKYLKNSEISSRIPDGLSEKDSITLTQSYINKWVQNEVLKQKAREILNSSEQDFTRQMEEYRNSLLLFAYEQKLISLYLDTAVTDAEIADYYKNNRSQFELKGNILKFDFVKLDKKSRKLKEFRKLMKESDLESGDSLKSYAERNATDYWFATDWIAMNQLLNEIPLEVDNQPLFLRRTQYTEVEDSLYVYMLKINDYRTTDSISPVEFERDKIRNIILNSRKQELIEKKREEIIDDAFKNNDAEVY